MQNIPEILNLISTTGSTNEKVRIIKENKSDILKEIFDYAYNPHITFGITKIDTSDIAYNDIIVDTRKWFSKLKDILESLSSRKLTGNSARYTVKGFISCYPESWGNTVINILNKDLRMGAGVKLINKVYKELIPEEFCQLASKYNDKKVKYPCYVDTKLDGLRGIAIVNENEIKLYSRNGKELKNYKVIEEELKLLKIYLKNSNAITFDGEITSTHFQDIMRTVTRKENGIEMASDALFNIFDIIYKTEILPICLSERLKYLVEIQRGIESIELTHIKVNFGKIVHNYEEIIEYYTECVKNGYEGIMIKDLGAIYEFKRSTNWMKMKPSDTEDLEIIGIEEGTGKYTGKLGAFICKLPNRVTVNVGTGFKDEEREEYWNKKDEIMGIIAEIGFQEKSRDGIPRFPTFKGFRKDKS